jgi:hypothetical protein
VKRKYRYEERRAWVVFLFKNNHFLFQIQELLVKGNLEAIIKMVFGPNAENRTRKCYDCQELVEGSDDVYAAHYDEVHQCEAAFTCEICDQVSSSASEYHSHITEHFKQPKPGRAKKKTTPKKYNCPTLYRFVCCF